MVMSSAPTGSDSRPSVAAIRAAMRSASGTPRVGMPSRTTSSLPWLRSRISCAMRVSDRATSESESTWRAAPGLVGMVATGDLLPRLTGRALKDV